MPNILYNVQYRNSEVNKVDTNTKKQVKDLYNVRETYKNYEECRNKIWAENVFSDLR